MDHAQLIRRMFETIDANNFEALSSMVDLQILYERPGFDPIHGWDAFLNFYRFVRIIRSGHHVVDTVLVDGNTAMSSGNFTGVQKDGAAVNIRFSELYRFSTAHAIAFRRTYFFRQAV